jgi:hypothetical protein
VYSNNEVGEQPARLIVSLSAYLTQYIVISLTRGCVRDHPVVFAFMRRHFHLMLRAKVAKLP